MFFLNPTYLWALLGLVIPIAIHLWSKKEGKTIKIGSIKLLSEADSKQSSSIKLNELWLLLLRMSLFTLLVIIMAEPQIPRKTSTTPITYIIEPSLLTNKELLSIIDTLESGESIRLLETGFPEFEKGELPPAISRTPQYWQLAKEMEILATDSIVVFTNAFVSGISGMRPQVNKNIAWIVLDQGETTEVILEAIQKKDKVQLQSVLSNYQSLTFEKGNLTINSDKIEFNQSKDSVLLLSGENQQWKPLKTEEAIHVLLFYNDGFLDEATYIEASLNAISKHLDRPIEIYKTQDLTDLDLTIYESVIWLSQQPLIQTSARVLMYKPDDLARSMVEKGSSNRVFYLTKPLHTENIFEEHLPEQLLAFLDLHDNLEKKINHLDKRVMERAELLTKNTDVKTYKEYPNILYISKWLWMLLAVLLVAERIIANYRKQ